MLELKPASKEAITFATKNYHYTKTYPSKNKGYSVFNNWEFCWVILYWNWATPSIWKPFWLKQWEIAELVRVALNWKQDITSKALAISMRLIKKDVPFLKMLVSYADEWQNHKWIIYQATNWIYIWDTKPDSMYVYKWKKYHSRSVSTNWYNVQFWTVKKVPKKSDCQIVKWDIKHKYIFPLTKELYNIWREKAKAYPKTMRGELENKASCFPQEESGAIPTTTLQNIDLTI